MTSFLHYEATKKLRALAEYPFDLAAEDNLTPGRIEKFVAESCGYALLFGTERVDEPILAALEELAGESEAVRKMAEMQRGAIVNKIDGFESENRAAMHTALRGFLEERRPEAELVEREVEKLKKFIKNIDDRRKYKEMILVGIGGSELGPRANYLALQHLAKEGRRVRFISNIDPDDAASVLRETDFAECLVIVVSKSGTTQETAVNERLLRKRFIEAGVDPGECFIAVTGRGSIMDDPSRYREVFYIWDWVGGRFSCSSMVGAVMFAFAFGFETYMDFLRGALAMDKAALRAEVRQNLPLLAALLSIWNHNFLGYPTHAIIPYSRALRKYPAHLQQVEMESNGKSIDKEGRELNFQSAPVIWGSVATNAQHSFFQLLHQGTEIVPIEFVAFKESCYCFDGELEGTTSQEKLLANLFAQVLALAQGKRSSNPNKNFQGNRPSHIILGNKLTPYSLGALLAFFEHKTVFEGFIWNINSFDQEGVQLGKELAGKIQRLFAAKRGKVVGETYPLGGAFLERLWKI